MNEVDWKEIEIQFVIGESRAVDWVERQEGKMWCKHVMEYDAKHMMRNHAPINLLTDTNSRSIGRLMIMEYWQHMLVHLHLHISCTCISCSESYWNVRTVCSARIRREVLLHYWYPVCIWMHGLDWLLMSKRPWLVGLSCESFRFCRPKQATPFLPSKGPVTGLDVVFPWYVFPGGISHLWLIHDESWARAMCCLAWSVMRCVYVILCVLSWYFAVGRSCSIASFLSCVCGVMSTVGCWCYVYAWRWSPALIDWLVQYWLTRLAMHLLEGCCMVGLFQCLVVTDGDDDDDDVCTNVYSAYLQRGRHNTRVLSFMFFQRFKIPSNAVFSPSDCTDWTQPGCVVPPGDGLT